MPDAVVTTRSLTLRPLTADDLATERMVRWHTDPEGYRDMVESPYADTAAFRAVGADWVDAWAAGGPSYWLAQDRTTGEAVGIGGVRRLEHEGRGYANLYYRLDPTARGRGLGREIASAAVAFGREWWPELPIVARIAEQNVTSQRIAAAAGMRRIGPWRAPADPVDRPAPVLYRSPAVLLGRPDEAQQREMVALWSAVNAAGGAVGFVGDAPRAQVAAVLETHLASEENTLVRLAEPVEHTGQDTAQHGALLGFGFVHRYSGVAAHRAHLERVMVDPAEQGRGLGRVLVADLHAVARAAGVELLTIGYRDGTGLGEFYRRAGYTEVGRLPGGLRLRDAAGVRDVDDVEMAYRLDGRDLRSGDVSPA